MIATLDDPFTRFLEPERFKNLQSGTKNALTGVGLSIGYPTENNGSPSGLVVVSASPGGPAYRAGISSGDIIVAIDDKSTENMGIYDAAECLQRERVLLNPVKSRICRTPGSGDKAPRVGYIKLTSFNQKASGAVKETIETLRRENVNAFVLDLRDNSGGLFPEGIEIAKICSCLKSLQFALKILGKRSQGSSCLLLPTRLDKGVIVYICDTRGVRDICDTAGSNAVAAAEPLAVLVNKGTASTSEILAGALKDNKRAVVFGESTYGKGKIQSVFKLSDGSGLAVTVARYETPAQTDIDKVGITPDCPLPSSFPKDDESFCGCIQDPAFACYLNRVGLFAGR